MTNRTIGMINRELANARTKYPAWPTDKIHALAILSEESGEAIRAALNHVYHGDTWNAVRDEVKQVAAMAVRVLEESDED